MYYLVDWLIDLGFVLWLFFVLVIFFFFFGGGWYFFVFASDLKLCLRSGLQDHEDHIDSSLQK